MRLSSPCSYYILLILTVFSCTCKVYAQVDTALISAQMAGNKEKLVKESVLLLYKNDKLIYKKEQGDMNLKSQEPIGAASQWLTTALIMTFVQEGKLSLNDKVSDYLPIFAKHGKGYITIAHCLTHNTGIQHEQGVGKIFQKSKFHTLEEEVNDYASKREINTNPGTAFDYSNIGFNIAGKVLEVLTKKAFDRLMTERVFRPLMMRNSTFANENYNDAISPSFGARSTAADYINFLSMLLNKGNFNGKPFLNQESIKLMFALNTNASAVKNAPKTVERLDYALGSWILQANDTGKPTVLAAPSLGGMWPIVNVCQEYALLHFTRFYNSEQQKDFVYGIMKIVDDSNGKNCK